MNDKRSQSSIMNNIANDKMGHNIVNNSFAQMAYLITFLLIVLRNVHRNIQYTRPSLIKSLSEPFLSQEDSYSTTAVLKLGIKCYLAIDCPNLKYAFVMI